jgi:hypothetical protein
MQWHSDNKTDQHFADQPGIILITYVSDVDDGEFQHISGSHKWSGKAAWSLCQSPAMPNGRCRMHGGKSPAAPKDNKNAFKHGRYTAEAIAQRREIAILIRAANALARTAQ